MKQQPWLISFEYIAVHARGNEGGTSRRGPERTVLIIDQPPWKLLAETKMAVAKACRPPYPRDGERLPDEITAVFWAVQLPAGALTEEEVDSLS